MLSYTDKVVMIVSTTVLTILLFSCVVGIDGLIACFTVYVIWFVVWAVLNTILYLVRSK